MVTKRKRLSKEQESLKQRVLSAYQKPYGFTYIPPNWDNKLWKKSTPIIHEYIQSRFQKTLDMVEYYSAMVFLWKTVPNTELLVEFQNSPQRADVAKTYNHTNQSEALPKTQQKSSQVNRNDGDSIEMPHKIKFDGEI